MSFISATTSMSLSSTSSSSWDKMTSFVQQSRTGLVNILQKSDETISKKSRSLSMRLPSMVNISANNRKSQEYAEMAAFLAAEAAAAITAPAKLAFGLEVLGLSVDVMAVIFSYLCGEDMCAFRACCKFTDASFHLMRDTLWERECVRKFGDDHLQHEQVMKNSYAKYLHNHLTVMDHEFQHVKSLAHCYQALSIYFSKNSNSNSTWSGVYGMVCDLFWADSEKIAMALSRNRYWALPTIIVDTEQRVYEFKRVTSSVVRNGPASFLTLSMAAQSFQDTSEEYRFMEGPSVQDTPGYIGFAVNLLRTRKEFEVLRITVLPILFKNLMVFETMEDKDNYESTLTGAQRINFRGIGLDETVDGRTAQLHSSSSRVYPCFRWRESRQCYYRNYPFLCSSTGAVVTNRPNKICTHSCSATHSSCLCKDAGATHRDMDASSPVSIAYCANVARPLGTSNTFSESASNNISGAGGPSFSTAMMASIDKLVVQGLERTKQTLTPLLSTTAAGTSMPMSLSSTSAGDCFYVSKVIDDLEKRIDRIKNCYYIVRYSY